MHRLLANRPRSGLLIDVSISAVALGGTLAVLSHGFTVIPGSNPGPAKLDAVGVLLAVCASVPLLGWRHGALGVFALTASAYVLLGGLGYAVGVPFGPTAVLYLLAASRDDAHPWTRRTTTAVIALLAAYLTATGLAQGRFPGSELFHTALAWGAAWFAGERTRLQQRIWRNSTDAPPGPSVRRSASVGWGWPRSAPASPATSTTRPATPST